MNGFNTDGTLSLTKKEYYNIIKDKFPLCEVVRQMRRYTEQSITGKYVPNVCTVIDGLYREEPLFDNRNLARFVLKPTSAAISNVFNFYKMHQAAYWVVEEIYVGDDMAQWITLNKDEQHFVKMVLAFFAFADGMVNENIDRNFLVQINDPEVRIYYTQQMLMECIHAETYTMLLDTYVTDTEEKEHLFNAVMTIPSIHKKAKWAEKWLEADDIEFDVRLIAFSIIEGVFFSGCFCAIFWLKKRGLLPGLTQSNELISRDEGIHTNFACLLHRDRIVNKIDELIVHDMFINAVNIEKEFICESLPVDLIGMNAKDMSTYIEFVADYLLVALGYSKLYHAPNPFPFMETISLNGKTNFFEKKVTEYKQIKLTGEYDSNASF